MKDMNISFHKLKSLPKDLPEVVEGDFYCDNNQLTSLEGSPRIIREWFFCCGNNKLTSLKGAPRSVGWYFVCYNNRLISLDFLPLKYRIFYRT